MEPESPQKKDETKIGWDTIFSLLLFPVTFIVVWLLLKLGVSIFYLVPPLALAGIIGIILSSRILDKIKASTNKFKRRKSVAAASYANFLLYLYLIALICYAIVAHPLGHVWDLFDIHGSAPRIPCVNNLKQIGLILNMYTNENEEMFPPIDDTKNNFIFDGNVLYPEYLWEIEVVACPGDADHNRETNFRLLAVERHPAFSVGDAHPDCITDISYCYFGWFVTSDEEAEAFFEAYDKLSPEDYDKDIIVSDGRGNGGGNVIHRLRTDADQFLAEGAIDPESTESKIPIAWDMPTLDPAESNHRIGEGAGEVGGYVLYLDGHVEFIEFGTKFPMTGTMARLLAERPHERIPDCE